MWSSVVPESARHLSRPDTFTFEGDGVNTYFPHHFSREGGVGPHASPGERAAALNEWRARTPFVDAVTLDLARRAVTVHETWHPHDFDRHVPMMVKGPGVAPGVVADRARVVDLSPTLAQLLRIRALRDMDGEARDVTAPANRP